MLEEKVLSVKNIYYIEYMHVILTKKNALFFFRFKQTILFLTTRKSRKKKHIYRVRLFVWT